MKKLALLGLVSVFTALTFISCQKTEKLNLPSSNNESPTLKSVVSQTAPADLFGSFTTDLLAGQNINAGTVTVANNAETLFVTYTTTGDWMIGEVHLYVGTKEGLPVNKKGNPQVGHFPTQGSFTPMVNTVTYEFPLSSLDECFIVAAHAVVSKVVNGQVLDSQTAWGDGTRMVEKGNWATYFQYCPVSCDPPGEEENCYGEETAWADGTRYVERGSWATYVTYQEGTVTLFAGQHMDAGTVSFSAVNNGMVTITIVMNEGWSQQEVAESVKIQGYNTAPSGNPAPGLFTTYKGNSLVVTVPAYDFYGVHLDVRHIIPCQ